MALVCIRLEEPGSALAWCKTGLRVAKDITDTIGQELHAKLIRRQTAANLLGIILDNYRASLKVTRSSPTRFTPQLCKEIFASHENAFFNGQFLETDCSSRFLATVRVLTSIVVFAWTPRDNGKGFGCQIAIGTLLYGCY
ncbi:unnamed protein product [Polarella glacialis]|uniref:Uncharacterized protein n=1 Tax=Polarella glacialis TaxID=89957 RepID=A0A813JVP0_POLGL|nr:unnamed protein product [Polarella glacialis]CAE8684659.1 unnamed protein product [Polarella glacialis]